MSRLLIALVLLLISLPLLAAQPAQVMLFGTFHFQDAELDTVKVKDIDIFTEENQAGNYELGANEIYQLGFRIAKLAGHERRSSGTEVSS
jgi:hypothetical protein